MIGGVGATPGGPQGWNKPVVAGEGSQNGGDGDVTHTSELNVSGLAGFLLAKSTAATLRCKPTDWYEMAFVLLRYDAGARRLPIASARERYSGVEIAALRTAINDL